MSKRQKIADPHHHIWNLKALHYPWLVDHPRHPRSYQLSDYWTDARDFDLVKSVHVEALPDPAEPVAETAWVQAFADNPNNRGFPHGIVAFADLMADSFADTLAAHSRYSNFRGVRQVLSWVAEPYMRENMWRENFGRLGDLGLSFDMQINPAQMEDAAHLANDYPKVQILLNHTGWPDMTNDRGFDEWRLGMNALAACENISVKISGFGMFDPEWTVERIRPFVCETIELFSPSRCMFASNFPVDRAYRSFFDIWTAFFQITDEFSETERSKMFHDNAVTLYRI